MEAATAPQPQSSAPSEQLESFNPATGELVGSVETITPEQVQGIVDDVARVQPAWAELSLEDRADYMRRAADVLLDEIDSIAELLSSEQGKPRNESYTMELLPTIDPLHWCADAGPEILADEKISYPQAFLLTKRSHFSYEPIGVVGVIAPWNYPWSIPFGEVAIALMAGNGVVLKPASLTPLLGERIRAVFEKAGFPEGLVRTVHGGGRVGDALDKLHSRKDLLHRLGRGRPQGRRGLRHRDEGIGARAGRQGPDDRLRRRQARQRDLRAPSGAASPTPARPARGSSASTSTATSPSVSSRAVAARAQKLRLGDPLDWETEIGPMTSEEQYETVLELVDDAVANGAEMRCGGPTEVPGLPGKFIAPTVLTRVTHEMRIMREEVFGPVLPIVVVDSEEEAVELANDSEFGLGASVWTNDRQKGERIARRIESGMVWINDHSFTHGACQCSWGGVKDSGLGRSHSKFGFYECTNIKLITWEPGLAQDFWWHPYDETLGNAIRSSAQLLYSRNGERIEALRDGIGPLLRVGARTMRRNGG